MVEAAQALQFQANPPRCLWNFVSKHLINFRNKIQQYVLTLSARTKFEPKAVEGMCLKTIEHGLYKVVLNREDVDGESSYNIIVSKLITFDESRFLGEKDFEVIMDGEVRSDKDYCDTEMSVAMNQELVTDNCVNAEDVYSNCLDCEYAVFNPESDCEAYNLNATHLSGDIVKDNAEGNNENSHDPKL